MVLNNYVNGNPVNSTDPSGLFDPMKFHGLGDFQYYGNYGGPNWTSGQRNSFEGVILGGGTLLNPIDSEGKAYLTHDKNYGKCRTTMANDKQWTGFNYADSQLISDLMQLPLSPSQWENPPDSAFVANAHRLSAIPAFLGQITVRSLSNALPEVWRNIRAIK